MSKISKIVFGYFLLFLVMSGGVMAVASAPECHVLWWFDNTTRTCATAKNFCGNYMYAGLKTFSYKNACLVGLKTTVTPVIKCGMCGNNCEKLDPLKDCPATTMLLPNNKKCINVANRCIVVLTSLNAKEGEACGGISGKKCETGLTCQMHKLNLNGGNPDDTVEAVGGAGGIGGRQVYPDQSGICVKTQQFCDNNGNCPGGFECIKPPSPCPIDVASGRLTTCAFRPYCRLIDSIKPVLGDANGDKKVDIVDFSIWKVEYLKNVNTKKSDFNNDGMVDMVDFSIWKNAYLNPVVTEVLPIQTVTLVPLSTVDPLPTVDQIPTVDPLPISGCNEVNTVNPDEGYTIVENTSSLINYSGTWTENCNDQSHGGSVTTNIGVVGSYAQLSFTGTAIRIVGTKGPTSGVWSIYDDDMPVVSKDMYSETDENQVVVYENNNLIAGTHIIRVLVSPAEANLGGVLRFDYFSYKPVEVPTSTLVPSPTNEQLQ